MRFGNFRGYVYWLFQAVADGDWRGIRMEDECKAQISEWNYGGNCLS